MQSMGMKRHEPTCWICTRPVVGEDAEDGEANWLGAPIHMYCADQAEIVLRDLLLRELRRKAVEPYVIPSGATS